MGNVPERIWATEDTENFGEDSFHSTTPMRGLTEYLRADIAAAREADLRAEVKRVAGERDDALRRAMEWQGNYEALALAIVGDTGASAILEAEKLRAEVANLRAMLDEARRERDDALARLSRMCGDA